MYRAGGTRFMALTPGARDHLNGRCCASNTELLNQTHDRDDADRHDQRPQRSRRQASPVAGAECAARDRAEQVLADVEYRHFMEQKNRQAAGSRKVTPALSPAK